MSKPRRREGGHEEEESEERWLITYADMITLLMAFFIMMYSMSVVDLKKFEDLSFAMGHVFGGGGLGAGTGEVSVAGQGLLQGQHGMMAGGSGWGSGSGAGEGAMIASRIQRQLTNALPEELRGTVELTRSNERITISMQASTITFAIGQATLTPQARQIITQLGIALRGTSAPMLVEGHTCDLPISTPRFPSNWELSAARANAVMLFLVRQCRIEPHRIATVGYAATRPRVPNTSDANRRRNRRVDIVVLPDDEARLRQMREGDRSQGRPVAEQEHDTSIVPKPVQIMPPLSLAADYQAVQAAEAPQDARTVSGADDHEEGTH